MYLQKDKPIHLSGIGGSAMRGLARILAQKGFIVTGTDPLAHEVTKSLSEFGIRVFVEQDGSHIPKNTQLLVATAALPENHVELEVARKQKIPVLKYAQMLGVLMKETHGIAVAGTHGKTSTVAMLIFALQRIGVFPGFVVGGQIPQVGAGADAGKDNLLVVEACEFDRSFLNLSPKQAIITNIDADHLDIYGDIRGVQEAFAEFSSSLPQEGLLVCSADWDTLNPVIKKTKASVVQFSTRKKADYEAKNILDHNENTVFDLYCKGVFKNHISLAIPGEHNVSNALAVLALCNESGYPLNEIISALAGFKGVTRRFDIKGEKNGVLIIDDYAHHPTEIKALLKATKQRYPNRRIVAVFQPHQISRTTFLLDDLAASFADAHKVVLTDIYKARDKKDADPSSLFLADKIKEQGTDVTHTPTLDNTIEHLANTLEHGDILLTIGAGNVDRVGREFFS